MSNLQKKIKSTFQTWK